MNKVYMFKYFPVDEATNFSFVFSSREKAVEFAVVFLYYHWKDEFLAGAKGTGVPYLTDTEEKFAAITLWFDMEGVGCYATIQEEPVNPSIGDIGTLYF